MTRISQWLQHDERLLTPDTGSTSPAMDYTIILCWRACKSRCGLFVLGDAFIPPILRRPSPCELQENLPYLTPVGRMA